MRKSRGGGGAHSSLNLPQSWESGDGRDKVQERSGVWSACVCARGGEECHKRRKVITNVTMMRIAAAIGMIITTISAMAMAIAMVVIAIIMMIMIMPLIILIRTVMMTTLL